MEIKTIKANRKRYFKFIAGFLGIIIVTVGGFFILEKYFSPSAKSVRQLEKQNKAYTQWEEQYKRIIREDVYGGKTPEETLRMFIEALKKEDIELASKYFMLDTNEQPYNVENYLTRNKWEEVLRATKEAGKLQEAANLLEKAEPDLEARAYEDDFKFVTRENGEIKAYINMEFNKDSGVWKIQSL